jgi:hypothetical protein
LKWYWEREAILIFFPLFCNPSFIGYVDEFIPW